MNIEIIKFAIEAHQKVNHLYDGSPYSLHLAMVVHNAYEYKHCLYGYYFEYALSACWLHDTIEDCRLTYNDILAVAGPIVADIVYALTNNKGKSRKERADKAYYHGIASTPGAVFVKLCDRLANVQYGAVTNRKMYEMYQKEHPGFIVALMPNNEDRIPYMQMIRVLSNILSLPI